MRLRAPQVKTQSPLKSGSHTMWSGGKERERKERARGGGGEKGGRENKQDCKT